MINWAEIKFPPLNLWSRPLQEIDYLKAQNKALSDEAIRLVDTTD